MQRPDGHYEYGYFTGNSAKYEVKTTDGITRGSYSYTDPNAVLRVTNYVADNTNGFRARNTEHGAAKNTRKELYSYSKHCGILCRCNMQYNITFITLLLTQLLFISTVTKNTARSHTASIKYFYIPYILNHGYGDQNTKNTENSEFMVGHELARITIPYSADLSDTQYQRSGKALNNQNELNEILLLVTQPGMHDESISNEKLEETKKSVDDIMNEASYSYLDTEGILRTTKDISDVALFGFKTESLNEPGEALTSVVASKLHGPSVSYEYDSSDNKSSKDSPGTVS